MNNNLLVPHFDDEKDDSLNLILTVAKDVPKCLIIALTGYLDRLNEQFLRNQIEKVIASKYSVLILDCSHLILPDDSFLVLAKISHPYKDKIMIVNLKERYHESFELIGIAKDFVFKNNIEEALAATSSNK